MFEIKSKVSPESVFRDRDAFLRLDVCLRSFGLTENESKLYLLLLQKNILSISKISKEMNVHRTNIYSVYQNLIKKGLVEHSFERPERLRPVQLDHASNTLISQRQVELSTTIRKIQDIKREAVELSLNLHPIELEKSADPKKFQVLKGGLLNSKLQELLPSPPYRP